MSNGEQGRTIENTKSKKSRGEQVDRAAAGVIRERRVNFVCFAALRPKSTAMVIAGRSVHLTTLFSWASLNKQFTSNRAHTFACN